MFYLKTKKNIIKTIITKLYRDGCEMKKTDKSTKSDLEEVKVDEMRETYTVIKINPYTLEEEIINYPIIIIDDMYRSCK